MKNIYLLTIDWATRDDANTTVFAYANFEDARFIEGKEELIPEDYLLPVRYE